MRANVCISGRRSLDMFAKPLAEFQIALRQAYHVLKESDPIWGSRWPWPLRLEFWNMLPNDLDAVA